MALTLRAFGRVVALTLLMCATTALGQAQTPIPPAPTEWVTDAPRLLSAQTASALNDRLRQYERKTGHQILVYIAPTTGGVPIEDWAVRAFERWKVGRKGLDDGLVLFIFTQDRTMRFEVGYGLESKVPDVLASRIIRDTITPALQGGQPDRGVTEGIDRILQLTGDAVPANRTETGGDAENVIALSPLQLVSIGLLLFTLLAVAVRSPWLALFLLVNIFGGRGGGGFSDGGGFSGGGGRSGGGGASGRW